jgi:hypothetical protein
MSQINDCLSDLNNDWEKRVDSVFKLIVFMSCVECIIIFLIFYLNIVKLKRIRSLLIACSNQYEDEFFSNLKSLQVAFTHQIKDLRSQIVREACITIA